MYIMDPTKEQLIASIKEWIDIDNNIRDVQKEMKEKRERKKELSKLLVDIMKDNEIDSFDIKGGSLIYKETKVRAPITKKNLTLILNKYFENSNKADEISNFILENREETIRESIQRKINN